MAYSERFDRAMALAVDSFRHKLRKSTRIPYVTHLLGVTALVGEGGGDEDQLIAAVLHDYLEDIPGASASELEQAFGPRVARLVLALSDSTDATTKAPWRQRKEAYLTHLRDQPAEVKLISAADKLHNCRCIVRDVRSNGAEVFQRFRGGRDGTLWYYRELVPALEHGGWEHFLLDELGGAVGVLQRIS